MTFVALPPDIVWLVAQKCASGLDIIALSQTCRSFHSDISPGALIKQRLVALVLEKLGPAYAHIWDACYQVIPFFISGSTVLEVLCNERYPNSDTDIYFMEAECPANLLVVGKGPPGGTIYQLDKSNPCYIGRLSDIAGVFTHLSFDPATMYLMRGPVCNGRLDLVHLKPGTRPSEFVTQFDLDVCANALSFSLTGHIQLIVHHLDAIRRRSASQRMRYHGSYIDHNMRTTKNRAAKYSSRGFQVTHIL